MVEKDLDLVKGLVMFQIGSIHVHRNFAKGSE